MEALTQRRILAYLLPLAAVWLLIAAEIPCITVTISRLPDPALNLAALGLAFSVAIVIESPILMLLSAGTALASHRQAYLRLLRFTHLVSWGLAGIHLLVGLTPCYVHILDRWIGAPAAVQGISRSAFLLLAPWTPMIAYRRLHEGVLIRFGRPRSVTSVTGIRLATIGMVLILGAAWGRLPGACVGTAALSAGVTAAAAAAWAFARPVVRGPLARERRGDPTLSWRHLLAFYAPLALMALAMMAGQPLLSFGLSRSPHPLESLAVWPVVSGLVFAGRSVGIAYQEVSIALLSDRASYAALRRFTFILAAAVTAVFAGLALTPGAAFWYRNISGLEPRLVELAILPTLVMSVLPGLTVVESWYRGLLMHSRNTLPVSAAVGVNFGVLLAAMLMGPRLLGWPGLVLAAAALSVSTAIENVYLWWASRGAALRVAVHEAPPGLRADPAAVRQGIPAE